jgi:23S rRNA pseudouridine1911/1915/1917 synthase
MTTPIVLLQSGGVLAIDKPAGLATQAPPGIDSVEAWVRRQVAGGPRDYLGVPHRLDRAVSGVLLMALTPRAARQLSRQFERREVGKSYLAIVAAAVAPVAGTWRDLVEKVPDEPRARLAAADSPTAREAVTDVHVVAPLAGGGRWLLELLPRTGRMHQLRLQAASRGMPIVGDAAYGGAAGWGPDVADPRLAAIALHAWRIAYRDPADGREVRVEAPPPAAWPAEVAALVSGRAPADPASGRA